MEIVGLFAFFFLFDLIIIYGESGGIRLDFPGKRSNGPHMPPRPVW